MEYAIGIDLGGTSIKYALVDKAGNSFFEGKLPSFASVSAAKVIEQLIKAVNALIYQNYFCIYNYFIFKTLTILQT